MPKKIIRGIQLYYSGNEKKGEYMAVLKGVRKERTIYTNFKSMTLCGFGADKEQPYEYETLKSFLNG